MAFNRSIIWFRNNLRLQDNEALMEGVQKSRDYMLLYVFDERLWKETSIGMPSASQRKLNFLWQSVQKLKSNIEKRGGQMIIRKGDPAEIIKELVRHYNCDAVFAPKEVGVFEQNTDEIIEKLLSKKGIAFKQYAQSTLFHEDDIPWPIGKLPDIFTQFRKENEKQTQIRDLLPASEDLKMSIKFKERELSAEEIDINLMPTDQLVFEGGEEKAWERLNYYFWETDRLKTYKLTRNGMLGNDYSSRFSPWLALGCISAKSIFYEVKKYEKERIKNQSTYWLIFELMWRDYFHFVLKKYKQKLFQLNGIKEEKKDWSQDLHLFQKWAKGETGVAFIDANMRELNKTGFMSNRGRQIVASFLVHDLRLDWRMGAWYFEYALIDYDVANNWGNWAYIAGVGNDPRENRCFNILSQAKKYDPKGDFVRYWLPELENIEGFNIHRVSLLDQNEYQQMIKKTRADYFKPIVDLSKWEY